MNHTIYQPPPDNALCQGDIVFSQSLCRRLEGHQDYFANNPRFTHYMVITQTCDLARDENRCDFILLAVVRRLDEALGIRQVEDPSAKDATKQLLRDLLNHNYNRRGFFYLPENRDAGVAVPSVVDLRVMFSIHKAHHDALLAARCGAMKDVYAAQLGHMVGHMFSRVATPGWEDQASLKDEVRRVFADLETRQRARLQELQEQALNGRCAVAGCEAPAKTFRWLKIRADDSNVSESDQLLCLEHARRIDNGRLVECIIRSDR